MPLIQTKINKPPKFESDFNEWVDYIEIIAAFSKDRELNFDGLMKKIKPFLKEDKKASPQMAGDISDDEEDDDEEEDIDEDSGGNENKVPLDKAVEKIKQRWDYIKGRCELFGTKYPFTYAGGFIRLRRNLSDHNKLYLVLLVCANLEWVADGKMNSVASSFEKLCKEPFKTILPRNTDLHYFGAGGNLNSIFRGNFISKVNILAQKLSLNVNQDFINNPISPRNNGDGGLDWVAWKNFQDGLDHKPIWFAQCACGDEWIGKQFDADIKKWDLRIVFNNSQPVIVHFVPRSYRKQAGVNWLRYDKLYVPVLFDRLRILQSVSATSARKMIRLYRELFVDLKNPPLTHFS